VGERRLSQTPAPTITARVAARTMRMPTSTGAGAAALRAGAWVSASEAAGLSNSSTLKRTGSVARCTYSWRSVSNVTNATAGKWICPSRFGYRRISQIFSPPKRVRGGLWDWSTNGWKLAWTARTDTMLKSGLSMGISGGIRPRILPEPLMVRYRGKA